MDSWDQTFWERTWRERSEAVRRAYGETDPPETVCAFSWQDRIRCPGACALALPPVQSSRDPVRHGREHWLYLTLGLSQPLDERQVQAERAAGRKYSALGIEFAFVTTAKSPWANDALYYFITYMTEGEVIRWGDRFPMLFHDRRGTLAVLTGDATGIDISPVGKLRAVLFWPYLFPDWELTTSTGKFMVLVATGITQAEWELAQQTTTVHLLLLLCRAGIGQCTIPDRACLLEDPRWRSQWQSIERMPAEECQQELRGFVGN